MVKTIQKTEKASSVTEILKDIYKVLDKTAEYRALHMKATCTKGCSSCCYLFTSMGVPEGLLIAEHLLQSGKWEEILPSLKQAALDNSFEGINKVTYFKKKLPCVFLKDNLCSIYEVRPAVSTSKQVSYRLAANDPRHLPRDASDLEQDLLPWDHPHDGGPEVCGGVLEVLRHKARP